MKITREWLENNNACEEGIKCWEENGCIEDPLQIIEKAKKLGEFSYTNWLVTKLFTKHQNVKLSVFAARQVLHLFEEQFPNDDRPRAAIEASERFLVDENVNAAYDAAVAAADATIAAGDAAYAAAYAAADAAYAAARDAAYAAYAVADADADADAVARAAYATARAGDAAGDAELIKEAILNYAIKLLKKIN